MSTTTFDLPDVGEGLTEAEILAWRIAPGETVTVNQTVVEIETAKAAVELPCPFDGTVVELLAAVGDTVTVGAPILTLTTTDGVDPGADPTDTDTDTAGAPETDFVTGDDQGSGAVLVGYGTSSARSGRRVRRPAAAPPAEPERRGTATDSDPPTRPSATPPVRKLAKELGVDLSEVAFGGERIDREDVRRHAHGATDGDRGGPAAGTTDEVRTPIKGVRKATAEAVRGSAFTAPHVTEFLTVDVTATMDTVASLKAHPAFAAVRVTPLLLVARALLSAIRHHPDINSRWDDDAQEIVRPNRVNLGIAAATPRGLVVPNIKDAGSLTLVDLARSIADLTATARDGHTTPEQMSGGTVTITNVGVFGVDAATPILNPGEAAILCFGAVNRRPWAFGGEVALREVTQLSLSFDHRLVDGELGSKVLARVGAVLTDPTTELLLD